MSPSERFVACFGPLLCADLAGWWRSLDCLFFFVMVIYFTMRLEYFLSSFEALTELDELRKALGYGVEPLDDELSFPLLWE